MRSMIKCFGLLIFLPAAIFSFAQSDASADSCSLLWSIHGNGLSETSYLFGTMHSNDDRLRRFDDHWRTAFESCDIIAGETDLSSGSMDVMPMLQAMMTDTTMDMVLQPEKVEAIRNYIVKRLGSEMAPMMMKMQPFFLMVLLMELPEDLTEVGEIMDIYLQDLALRSGKKVQGLETSTEQLEVISGVPVLYQAELLFEFVSMSATDLPMDFIGLNDSLLIQTYLNQCLDEFVVLSEQIDFDERLMTQMLPVRNVKFVNRLEELFKLNSVFCAVGALHLPGNNGMIALLRERGYHVTPVFFKFSHE
jgi:uncharacterized protein YbaP (TraB family)